MSAAYLRLTARLIREKVAERRRAAPMNDSLGAYAQRERYNAADLATADWLDATADRMGGKSWTGSRHALAVARAWRGDA